MIKRICLIGKGNVGTSLLQLLNDKKDELMKKFDISYKLIAIFEYDGALINEKGINIKEVLLEGDGFCFL